MHESNYGIVFKIKKILRKTSLLSTIIKSEGNPIVEKRNDINEIKWQGDNTFFERQNVYNPFNVGSISCVSF